jgi:hypothetical protein
MATDKPNDSSTLGLLLAFSLASSACSHKPCESAQEDGPEVAGGVRVVLADAGSPFDAALPCGSTPNGAVTSFPLYPVVALSDSADAVTVRHGLVAADGRVHLYDLHVDGLSPGATVSLEGHGQLCVATSPLNAACCTSCAPNGPQECCPMQGTLAVRQVSSEGSSCSHSNACAQSIDATLSMTSNCAGMQLAAELTLKETGRFVQDNCPRPEIP